VSNTLFPTAVPEPEAAKGVTRKIEKLDVNLLTVGSLLLLVTGGSISFGILYEQNRRHEATLSKMVDVVDELRLLSASHSHAIVTLKDEIEALKRKASL
jgi:hypothetical protein